MAFASDTFTDTSGTLLASHVAVLGGTWVKHTSYGSSDLYISNANRCRALGTTEVYYSPATPSSADYTVQADLTILSALAGCIVGVVGRVDTAADTMYIAWYKQATGAWGLRKHVAGTATALGADVVQALVSGDVVQLSMIGTTIKLIVNGITLITVTDSAITAVGKAGVYANLGSDSTGYHLDNFSAVNVGTAPVNTVAPAVTGTPTVGQTLTATDGTWTGDISSGPTYQWKDAAGNIVGATSSTYVVGSGERGASVRCTVTETGTGGSSSADSNAVTIAGFNGSYAGRLEMRSEIVVEYTDTDAPATTLVFGSNPAFSGLSSSPALAGYDIPALLVAAAIGWGLGGWGLTFWGGGFAASPLVASPTLTGFSSSPTLAVLA